MRECYIDKKAKDNEGNPLKRFISKEFYRNLSEVDRNRLIKEDQIKVAIPKEFNDEFKSESNQQEDRQGIRIRAKYSRKPK